MILLNFTVEFPCASGNKCVHASGNSKQCEHPDQMPIQDLCAWFQVLYSILISYWQRSTNICTTEVRKITCETYSKDTTLPSSRMGMLGEYTFQFISFGIFVSLYQVSVFLSFVGCPTSLLYNVSYLGHFWWFHYK